MTRVVRTDCPRAQRGTTLLEGLVSFLVLCLGMLTVARMQTQLHLGAELADQRSQAIRLAQQELESLRDFSSLAPARTRRAYADLVSGSHPAVADTGTGATTAFVVARQIDPASGVAAKAASVTVHWSDRGGQPQQVTLHTIIAAIDPATTGALALARRPGQVIVPLGPPGVPPGAQDLGHGASVLRSAGDPTLAYLLDNASARVTGRCTGVGAGVLSRSDLTHCDERAGYLISGVVRFAFAGPGEPAPPGDALPGIAVGLVSAGVGEAAPPVCTSGPPVAAEPGGASPPASPHVAYDCLVSPAGASWTGTTVLQPSGWRIGTGPGEHRVCRYVGSADAAAAPGQPDHVGVARSIAHQNFLVIPAAESCPLGAEPRFADAGARHDPQTVPHQP